VSEDHLNLVQGGSGARAALDDNDIDLVVWSRDSGTAARLATDPAWRVLYTDEDWALLCRRDADLGGHLGTC
jgi:hypothetical protein